MKKTIIPFLCFCLCQWLSAQPDPAYRIDAAIPLPGSRMILWGGSEYIRFDMEFKKVSPGYPKKILEVLEDFPFPHLDAAVVYENGKCIFFSGNQYIPYNLAGNRPLSEHPLPLDEKNWPGVPFRKIDAAFAYDNNFYLFSGTEFTIFDPELQQAQEGYPRKIDTKSWPGLPFTRVDAAFNYQNRIIYFFSDNQYASFDVKRFKTRSGYPKEIAGNWKGVRFSGAPSPEKAPPVPAPHPAKTGIHFLQGTFKEAGGAAAEKQQILMVDAFASWCAPCQTMEKEIFSAPRVAEFYNNHFINFRLDAEAGEGIEFAWERNVNAYPTIIYFSPAGKEIHRFVGTRNEAGFIREGEKALALLRGTTVRETGVTDQINEDWFSGKPAGTEIIPALNSRFEHQVLDLVNAERRKKGLGLLTWREDLGNSARYHAADMASDDYFDHNTYDRNPSGKLVLICDTWERIKPFASSPGAENIAAGQVTPAAVVTSWMNSPGHKANILNPSLKYLGVGYYYKEGNTYGHYWVQNFGY